MASKPVQGNLQSVLSSYEKRNETAASSVSGGVNGGPSDLSLQLDDMVRDRSSTLGSLRDRGFTFGSEFDLGLGLGTSVEGSQVTGLEIFVNNTTSTQGNVVSANSSSSSSNPQQRAANVASPLPAFQSQQVSIESRGAEGQQSQGVSGETLAPPFSSEQYPNYNSTVPESILNNNETVATGSKSETKSHSITQSSTQTLDEGSPSAFLNGVFGSPTLSINQNILYGQTPPSNVATSYENKRFGKRMRSGSISGRLRSMSDLENRGIINQQQKGMLKDLVISGNDDLQVALDKYEQGDTSELVTMINSGVLNNKDVNDIDILADLDFDFLNVNEDFNYSETKPMPIPTKQSTSNNRNQIVQGSNSGSGTSTPKEIGVSLAPLAPHSSYDAIGELDFNADYGGNTDNHPFIPIPQGTFTAQPQVIDVNNYPSKASSDPIEIAQRFRANSLAFGDLLDEPNAENQQSVGKWMDQTPIITDAKRNSKKKQEISSQVVGANGGLYILNNRSSNGQTAAAIKQRVKEEKKREKLEKKELREQQMREKKKKDAKERQVKKDMRAAMSKLKQEEKKKMKRAGLDLALRKTKNDEMEGSDEDLKEVPSGSGRPRSLSDPNLSVGLDENGLMHVDAPPDWVGAYSPPSRKLRIERFLAKRSHRVWVKKVKYDVRKNFADSRLRVKGRFVKKEDELLMRDLMSLT